MNRRRIGKIFIVLGVVALAYGAAVYFWHDPATDLYARWQQHRLSSKLEETFEQYTVNSEAEGETALGSPAEAPSKAGANETGDEVSAPEQQVLQAAAKRFEAQLELGQPLGRIIVPKLDIDPVFVHGTRWGADLSRGPGHYPQTDLPGLGRVTAIAGHRTTFGAPFRHIDRLKRGDEILLKLPYGTFRYEVSAHKIVGNDDWSIIKPTGFDTLVLSACHPLFSASQRWIVFSRLVGVELPDGQSFDVQGNGSLVAAPA